MGGAPNTGPIPMMVPPPRIPMPGNPLMRPPGIPFSPQSGGILQRPGMPSKWSDTLFSIQVVLSYS